MGVCCCFSHKGRKSQSKVEAETKPEVEISVSGAGERAPYVYKSNHVQVTTYFADEDIEEMQLTPRRTVEKKVHFACPICMSYFSTILESKCCGNYVCHKCAKDMITRSATFEVRCPHCNADPLILSDVDVKKSVRVYSDSFAKARGNHESVARSSNLNPIPEAEAAPEDEIDNLPVKDSPRWSEHEQLQ